MPAAAATGALQETADDEVHAVALVALPPTRPALLQAASPKFDPRTVTLAAPVAPVLARTTALARAAINVTAEVTLPNCTTAVSEAPHAVLVELTDLHATALADVHKVVSLPLPPSREAGLKPAPPAFEPSSVTLDAPVAAAFTTTALLTRGRLKDTAAMTDARICKSVIATVADAPTPAADLHRIEVADAHTDDTMPLPRTDACELRSRDL